jgi:protein-S-isoprenylcysteine O-methyltransferase Ste14
MVESLRVGNRVRAVVWALMLAAVLLAGRALDERLGLQCDRILCTVAGVAWIAVIVRAAAVTGRYLAVYGKSDCRRGFGEIDRLVRVGPYSCMRHPMHLFLSQLPPAIALAAASLAGVLVGFAFTLLILYMAVTVDERESISRFGSEYLRYRREVPAISLKPSCLAKALARMPEKRCGKSVGGTR